MTNLAIPMIAGLGPTELLIILGVVILLFGATKLPDLARGSGRALRIFKSETKGLVDDDEEEQGSVRSGDHDYDHHQGSTRAEDVTRSEDATRSEERRHTD